MQKYQTHRAPQGETCPLCGAWEDEKDDVVCRSWVPPTSTDERMATIDAAYQAQVRDLRQILAR